MREVAVLEAFQRLVEPAKCLGYGRQQCLPLVGQSEAARQTSEQFRPEALFQPLDLLADGGLRHTQFEAGPREAEMPCGRFEGAQGIEG